MGVRDICIVLELTEPLCASSGHRFGRVVPTAAVVVVPMRSGSSVTESEELMGNTSLLSRLPQYLITAMLEAHVAVATYRCSVPPQQVGGFYVTLGRMRAAQWISDPFDSTATHTCGTAALGKQTLLPTLTPLLAFLTGDSDIM
jgi:hypothetical protein